MKTKTVLLIIILLIFVMLTFSCSQESNQVGKGKFADVRVEPQGYVELEFKSLPKYRPDIARSERYSEPLDDDSVQLWKYRGGVYYQATNLCHDCQAFISTYHYTNKLEYLKRAEKTVKRIMTECLYDQNHIPFASFKMKYAVHSDSNYSMNPTWVSGMTQGDLLIVLSRLYEFTGKEIYLNFADSIFRSFYILKRPDGPWFTRIDENKYYWIEEYPHDSFPGMTLNGFNTAVFGLYDYYRITKKDSVKGVYDMAITTLKHYLPEFRRPNELSYYCLGHKKIANEAYHNLHIRQMQELHRITGDPFFKIMKDVFKQDKILAELEYN